VGRRKPPRCHAGGAQGLRRKIWPHGRAGIHRLRRLSREADHPDGRRHRSRYRAGELAVAAAVLAGWRGLL